MSRLDRLPTMEDSLRSLLACGVEINSVIDIGILNGTEPLMSVFPSLTHYLFEPVKFHFDGIKRRYKEFDYKLFEVALSDQDEDAYLIGISVDGTETITHSQIRDYPIAKDDDARVIACNKIRKARLDTVIEGVAVDVPYIIKVDVDGHELAILRGAESALKNASVVVVEAPLQKLRVPQLIERYQHLTGQGFALIDIVDFAYYGGILWQVDLVFVKVDIVNRIPELCPFESTDFEFDRALWRPLTKRLVV